MVHVGPAAPPGEAPMKPRHEVLNDPARRTIRVRMEGQFDATSMRRFAEDYVKATAEYAGREHVVLADMRGMLPSQPEVEQLFGDAIGFGRRHGAIRCAHLSDDTVQRLQAARLGRLASPRDDVTIDVISLEEAELVLAEARRPLK
jgi:hypothetical protein